jgi:hypothetical protein
LDGLFSIFSSVREFKKMVATDSSKQLNQLDDLIGQFRTIEQLFRVMGAVSDAECDAEIARGCSEIGMSLTANFRERLEKAFGGAERQDADDGQRDSLRPR